MVEEVSYVGLAKEALTKVKAFDPKVLPQADRLSTSYRFTDAVEPAKKLIELFSRISLSSLDDLPKAHCETIKNHADQVMQKFQEILDFDETQNNAYNLREQIITQLKGMYDNIFNKILQLISYSASVSVDFQRMETEARNAIKEIENLKEEFEKDINETKSQTAKILTDIREAAAEQGVTQMAHYFAKESKSHRTSSRGWLIGICISAIFMIVYAVSSLWFHRWFLPTSTYENIQLAVSKVLMFAVLSYSLYLCARNFLANKHNEIVNKHRQNALMTYTTIADAAADEHMKDVVTVHAAMCIYSPQSTGYARHSGDTTPTTKSIVELLTKPFTADTE